jgi:hypothetical protein
VAEAVFAGKLDAARFVLRTIGRRRGYGKPMTADEEAHVPNLNGPLPPWNMPDRFTDEQEAKLRRIMNKGCPARPAYFDRLDPIREEIKKVIAKNFGNLGRTAKRYDLSRSELVEYMQGDWDFMLLLVDLRETSDYEDLRPLISDVGPLVPEGMDRDARRKLADEMYERAKIPGPEMEKILLRFKPPLEVKAIVESWNDLDEGVRRVIQYEIMDHIETQKQW